MTQIVAFPAALIFGRLSGKYKNASLIKICIAAYFLIALYGITLKEQYQFWILAVCVGIFQGAISPSPDPILPGSFRLNAPENTLASTISAERVHPSSEPLWSPQ